MNATYSVIADGIADLALPVDLDQRLRNALDGERGTEIRFELDEAITAKLNEHGVDDEGVWLGEWDAAAIVTDILNRHDATQDL